MPKVRIIEIKSRNLTRHLRRLNKDNLKRIIAQLNKGKFDLVNTILENTDTAIEKAYTEASYDKRELKIIF